MARQATPIAFKLPAPRGSDAPKYAEIKEGIVRAIRSGALSAEKRLPSTRRLAEHLGVARITVSTAYELLEAEGWIRSRQGAGSYVMPLPSAAPGAAGADDESSDGDAPPGRSAAPARPVPVPGWRPASVPYAPGLADTPGVISFDGTRQDPTLFPMAEVRRSLNFVLQRDGALSLQAEEPEGFDPLRRAITRMLEGNGIALPWQSLIVTSGSQQAIDLAARVLVEPGEVVLTESPTFPGALEAFAARGARLVGLPMDENGLVVDGLDSLMRRYRPRLLYTNPTFHNPTGSTLPLERRRAIIRLAAAFGCYVVEDDGYSLLRYAGAPPPPIAALAAETGGEGRVIHLGSLSNVLPPGLRLGYVGVPASLQPQFVAAKQAADLHTSSLLQRAAAVYLQGDHVRTQLRRLRQEGRRRRDAMLRALQQANVPGLEWWRPSGGPSLWMALPSGVDATRLYAAAVRRGVAYRIGAASYVDRPSHRTIGLSFLAHRPPAIQEGVRRLTSLLRGG